MDNNAPGSGGGGGDFGSALGASARSFSGIGGGPLAASGASTPSERGLGLRGQARRQDSTGSVATSGGGTGGLSVTGGFTAGAGAGAASESKQGGGEVSRCRVFYGVPWARRGWADGRGRFV